MHRYFSNDYLDVCVCASQGVSPEGWILGLIGYSGRCMHEIIFALASLLRCQLALIITVSIVLSFWNSQYYFFLQFKLCKVRSVQFGQKGIPYLNTYDGRTIRYPDPLIKANDTIKLDLENNKITDFIKFDVGNVVMVTGGRNRGRVGVIKNREKHKGTFETIHVQDASGHEFATRLGNVFTIGKGTKPWVSLPKGKGIKLTVIEEARKRQAAQSATAA